MIEQALAGMHVLVLEDELLIAMDVEQLCRDLGAGSVAIVRRVAELPDAPAGSSIDFAVVDVSVGGASTLDFAHRLRMAGVPFIFATGYTETDSLFAAFPGTPVLSKPYSPDAFARAGRAVYGARGSTQAAVEPRTRAAIASGP